MSSRCQRSTACSIMPRTPSAVPTSTCSVSAVPPAARIVSTFWRAASSSTSAIRTRAPSSAKRRAVAPPMPIAPPVTIATRPSRRGKAVPLPCVVAPIVGDIITSPMTAETTQVLIVGAGPVGLTLALDLGRRGVRCTLVERNEQAIQLPKMERCNGRTMEIYRRLGIAETIRDAGLPREAPMDVFLTTSLGDAPLAHLPYPSVAAAKADIAAHNDGSRLLEPYQLISQYTLEPLLRSFVEPLPSVTVRFGCELESYAQDAAGVSALVAGGTIRAQYLVGCDGGSSTVRKQAGIRLEGRGGIRTLRQALFHCPQLY